MQAEIGHYVRARVCEVRNGSVDVTNSSRNLRATELSNFRLREPWNFFSLNFSPDSVDHRRRE